MERNRLTNRQAGEAAVNNDVYTLNGARTTGDINPASKYEIGGPDQFNETPLDQKGTAALHDKDVKDRDPATNITNLREAALAQVRTAAENEKKAMRCLVAAQRMLPGAEESVIEATAADLVLHMPTASVDALLARQEAFARRVASEADASIPPVAPVVPAEDKPVDAAPAVPAITDASVTAAAPAPAPAPAADPAALPFAPAPVASTDDLVAKLASVLMPQIAGMMDAKIAAAAPAKKDDKDGEDEFFGKKASATSIDDVFSATSAPATKRGATSLVGLVSKQASSAAAPAVDSLEALWVSAPDVTGLF